MSNLLFGSLFDAIAERLTRAIGMVSDNFVGLDLSRAGHRGRMDAERVTQNDEGRQRLDTRSRNRSNDSEQSRWKARYL